MKLIIKNQQYSGVPFDDSNNFDFLIFDILKSPILQCQFEKIKILAGLNFMKNNDN